MAAEKRLATTAPQVLDLARLLLGTTNAPNANCQETAAARFSGVVIDGKGLQSVAVATTVGTP
jgi:hypothetical protein